MVSCPRCRAVVDAALLPEHTLDVSAVTALPGVSTQTDKLCPHCGALISRKLDGRAVGPCDVKAGSKAGSKAKPKSQTIPWDDDIKKG